MQGIGTMELALQNSVPYTRERMSMRALRYAIYVLIAERY